MKIRITIIGVLEVQFEREAKVADWPVDEFSIKFFKECIAAAAEEARKLQLPPATAPANS